MSDKGAETRERILAAAEALILREGYAGMSIDRLLKETGLAKGGFFHHFKGKAELARSVLERYAANDLALFTEWSKKADRLSDDPLERILIFLRLFEEFLDDLGEPFPGCIFASYTYESRQFGPDVAEYIRMSFENWAELFEVKLEAVVAARPSVNGVTANGLAEMVMTIIEGGFIMANAYGDKTWVQRQIAEYRRYLQLLFDAE